MKKRGKRALNLDIPENLYNMFAKLCIDAGITKTEAIVRYINYLQQQRHGSRRLLDEDSKSNFKLDEGEPR